MSGHSRLPARPRSPAPAAPTQAAPSPTTLADPTPAPSPALGWRFEDVPVSAPERGEALPQPLRTELEASLQTDLSPVRVHRADEQVRAFGAEALAHRTHLHFAPGRYAPHTPLGRAMIGHELAHVVQQAQGRARASGGQLVQENPGLEHEADEAGARAAHGVGLDPSGTSLALARIPTSQPATAPIQLLKTHEQLQQALTQHGVNGQDQHLTQIKDALRRYHQTRDPGLFSRQGTRQTFADNRAGALHDAEHSAYQYLMQNMHLPDDEDQRNTAKGTRREIMSLLDEIQKAHIDHTDYVHRKGLKVYVPGRSQMTAQAQSQIDADWNKARNLNAGIRVANPEMAKQVRAMHARLMTGQRGRELLHNVLDASSGKTVTINATPADDATPEERRARRGRRKQVTALEPQYKAAKENADRIGEQMDQVEQANEEDPRLPGLQNELDEALAERDKHDNAMSNLRDQGIEDPSPGVASAVDHGADWDEGHDQHGVGSSSTIPLRSGLRDSELMVRGQDNNQHEGYLPTPAFILYGHELIHALHNKTGRNARNLEQANYISTDQQRANDEHAQHEAWTSREEHETINLGNNLHQHLTENELRAEHGLGTRINHQDTKSFEEIDEDNL